MKKILLAAAMLFTAANAQQNLLELLQDKFSEVEDLTVNIEQYTNGTLAAEGKFYYKAEDNVRLEMESNIIISDGETNWNYNKKQDKVVISNYDDSEPSILALNDIVYKYPEECSVEERISESLKLLKFIPGTGSKINVDNVILHINSKYLIDRIEIEDFDGNIIRIDLEGYELNNSLDSSLFSYKPSGDTEVIDIRY